LIEHRFTKENNACGVDGGTTAKKNKHNVKLMLSHFLWFLYIETHQNMLFYPADGSSM
jgi:hypothetical protein